MKSASPRILLPSQDKSDRGAWLAFDEPHEVIEAHRLGEVLPALERVEAGVDKGFHAAGFLSYEAAPAFDPHFATRRPGPLPLVWWGLFSPPRRVELPPSSKADLSLDWRPALSRSQYLDALRQIRGHIAAGDTYQVNYTFQLTSRLASDHPLRSDPLAAFADLYQAQPSRFCAFVDLGRFAILSLSPELFFTLDGDHLRTRPMKGTARRGRFPEEDQQRALELAESGKNRAENVMIVDMLRNDLGKIAEPGSVEVEELFAVETYPTVHQMTSTISARSNASWCEILRALFPCASITGAPKIRTTHIIRQLETSPRGVYTGAIGYLAPGRQAWLNVAIRTLTLDRQAGRARYGTGGGIVWDSEVDAEYDECRAKALFLTRTPPSFELLETLLWRPRSGFFLLERHLQRLLASAAYFAFELDETELRRRLRIAAEAFAATAPAARQRTRLLVDRQGRIMLQSGPWPCSGRDRWTVALDDRPIDASDPFLFHKTTHRQVYDQALRRHPGLDDVVLWNAKGELTESTRANLVLKMGDNWLTPPVACGLLAGTCRAEWLARGRLREAILTKQDFAAAEQVLLINSLRGVIRAERAVAAEALTGRLSVP